jgi:hypothetical protein
MGVEIDETWSHSQALGIDDAVRAAGHAPDLGNPITYNGNVSNSGRKATTVVDPATLDD